LNLYGFCGNNPINKWDVLGCADAPEPQYVQMSGGGYAEVGYTSALNGQTVVNPDVTYTLAQLIASGAAVDPNAFQHFYGGQVLLGASSNAAAELGLLGGDSSVILNASSGGGALADWFGYNPQSSTPAVAAQTSGSAGATFNSFVQQQGVAAQLQAGQDPFANGAGSGNVDSNPAPGTIANPSLQNTPAAAAGGAATAPNSTTNTGNIFTVTANYNQTNVLPWNDLLLGSPGESTAVGLTLNYNRSSPLDSTITLSASGSLIPLTAVGGASFAGGGLSGGYANSSPPIGGSTSWNYNAQIGFGSPDPVVWSFDFKSGNMAALGPPLPGSSLKFNFTGQGGLAAYAGLAITGNLNFTATPISIIIAVGAPASVPYPAPYP
jgi:hypothetical protein